ncbi:SpoIIE family protein phosphatase [Streptomyces sp. NPDC002004]
MSRPKHDALDPGRPTGQPARSVERDRIVAAAVREAVEVMGCAAAVVFLVDPASASGDLKAAAVAGIRPAVFALRHRIALTETVVSAKAYQDDMLEFAGMPRDVGEQSRLATTVPFPNSAAAVPISAGGQRLGALTTVWTPPLTEPLSRECLERLSGIAHRLCQALSTLADRGTPVTAGPRTVLVPMAERTPDTGSDGLDWGVPEIPGSSTLSFMYHLHKLATALNEAVDLQDVVRAGREWIMQPFGAQGFVVSLASDGRSWVAGHSGYPMAAVKHLHGRSIDRHAPDTAVLLDGIPLFLDSPEAWRADGRRDDFEDGMQAWAFLPLEVSGHPIGTCLLGFEQPRRFTPAEQAVVMMMTDLLGQALERVRLTESRHQIASGIQKRLLPRALSEVPQVLTTARYLPAPAEAEAGGDWYDVITEPGGGVALVVGDVEGRSLQSAVLMGQLRSAIRAYATDGRDAGQVLTRTSRLLAELDGETRASCCLVRLDVSAGTAEIASAGHPAPLIRRPEGTIEVPDMVTGPPLGALPLTEYRSVETDLTPGTLLLLYTDGFTAAVAADPVEGALRLFRDAGDAVDSFPDGLADRLVAAAQPASAVPRDDAVVLLARFEGAELGPHHHISRINIARHDLAGVESARRFIRDRLHFWGLDELVGDLELMASEIVTNALIHADSDVDLRLREYPDHVRLEVRDSEPTPSLPAPVMPTEAINTRAEHGRGLLIVDGLASQWGSAPSGRGKTIWLEITTPERPEPDSAPEP